MDSGIYVLTFSSGEYYIGKSENIPNRWKQHFKDFAEGKHARKMQECFDRCGYPATEVFIKCHSDHIDLYESMAIRANLGPNCLNTAIPRLVPAEDQAILLESGEYIELSTAQHLKLIKDLTNDLEYAKQYKLELEKLRKKGVYTKQEIKAQLEELNDYKEACQAWKEKVQRLENRGLFARIFNLK